VDYFGGVKVWASLIEQLAKNGYNFNSIVSVVVVVVVVVVFFLLLRRPRRHSLTFPHAPHPFLLPLRKEVASYDWRLAFQDLERKDLFLTKTKHQCEMLYEHRRLAVAKHRSRGDIDDETMESLKATYKVVVVAHSMGGLVRSSRDE
jgi:hypothetical protein